jgi:hypothetical protein
LIDVDGKVVCELPCSSRVEPGSGYVVEGVRSPPPAVTSLGGYPLRLTIPNSLPTTGNGGLLGLVRPQRGSPDGAIAAGVLSGLVLTIGVVMVATASASVHCGSACSSDQPPIGVSLGVLGAGAVGEVAAIVWALHSQRPKLDLIPAIPHASSKALTLIRLLPLGLAAAF